jgi:hypothetical protein
MQFRPPVSPALRERDARIFRPEAMGLAAIIAGKRQPIRSARLNAFLTGAES